MPNYELSKRNETNFTLPFRLKMTFGVAAISYLACFTLMHMRLQSTILGYRIGQLKKEEVQILKAKSRNAAELARLTRMDELIRRADKKL